MVSGSARKRIQLCLSAERLDPQQVVLKLAPALGERFGGASFQPHTGVWSTDADVERERYGPGVIEPGLQLTVSVLPDDIDAALDWLRGTIAALNVEHEWGLEWIHTEVTDVAAHHFSLSAVTG